MDCILPGVFDLYHSHKNKYIHFFRHQVVMYHIRWRYSLHQPLLKEITTIHASRKLIRITRSSAYDTQLIFARFLDLPSACNIKLFVVWVKRICSSVTMFMNIQVMWVYCKAITQFLCDVTARLDTELQFCRLGWM